MCMIVYPALSSNDVRERFYAPDESFVLNDENQVFIEEVFVDPPDLSVSSVIGDSAVSC